MIFHPPIELVALLVAFVILRVFMPTKQSRRNRTQAKPRHVRAETPSAPKFNWSFYKTATAANSPRRSPHDDFVKKRFLSPTELKFLERLTEAALPLYTTTQVAMNALLDPGPATIERCGRLNARTRFSQKVVDYVLMDDNGHVQLLVELDDRTHRASTDADRDEMTRQAGYATLRVDCREHLDVDALRRRITAALP